MTNSTSPNWSPDNLKNLFVELTRIRGMLKKCIDQGTSSPTPETESLSLPETTSSSSLNQLCHLFNISPFERDILLLCLGMELDPDFSDICAQVSPYQTYPTFALAVAAFPRADFRFVSSRSPLLGWQLVQVGEGLSFTQSPLRIDHRILCYLLGEPEIDAKLSGLIRPISTDVAVLAPSHQHLANQISTAWLQTSSSASLPIFQLCGADITSKQSIAAVACQQFDCNLMQMSAEFLPTSPDECHHLLQRWHREAILTNCVLLLDCDTISPADPLRAATLAQFIEGINSLLIVSTQERLRQRQRPLLTHDVPPLTHQEQLNLWQTHLGANAGELNGDVNAIVSQFNLSTATIQAACLHVNNQGNGEEKEALKTQIWNFCRSQARPHLDDLAQRMESSATWEDLVLPEREKRILQEIATHLRHRSQVYQDWGFAKKGGRGLGISALFHGQSGTGKTLAAEVLAREFRLDLYRIDLSATVSKYIGETEKNLRRIFDAAETGGAVLLFDEADAIFGKRSEVKDSHDRHANVEVAYLLQRMEAYQGLAILTTNLKDSLDQAFSRRIRFMVQFPFPDTQARAEIWQRAFPPQTPTEDIAFDKLAKLNVSGGNIRNIALNAAFLAADGRKAVRMSHLVQASQREYLKIGRSLTDSEIKGWI
ncbi:AAA+ family ATPase [Cylindrospermum stagnale PCC 7417]|uniref:AAA+ family ATPase n=1 Tax=Cylindrospermum stagnale PCC 7417 TaxID=56107 RepID=K9WTY7_9NOST|nr:ATP-binding protein [Cylindrospermum stagnale]AFZ23002.1 AAA+ family ATPase [Cylindrospermum stagnale PCC 7417]